MIGSAWTVVLTLVLTALSTHFQEPRRFLSVPETALRQRIAVGPVPAYPAESLKAAVTGVVVAEAFFAADGRFETIEILESPDTHTAASVRTAVKGWALTSGATGPRGEPAPALRGKLTFYFRIRDGKGLVLNPDQMPGRVSPPGRPRPPGSGTSATQPGTPPSPPRTVAGHGEDLPTITAGAFKKSMSPMDIVLDVGEREAFKRGHWPGAVNIPRDELAVRGPIELPREKRIVIDCTQEALQVCRFAGSYLAEQGLTDVVLLVR